MNALSPHQMEKAHDDVAAIIDTLHRADDAIGEYEETDDTRNLENAKSLLETARKRVAALELKLGS